MLALTDAGAPVPRTAGKLGRALPMRNDHRHVLGMLDAESDKLNAFDDEDLQFLERAGGLIAHCLH